MTALHCAGIASSHDGRDVQVTTILDMSGLPRRDRDLGPDTPLCAGCRSRVAEYAYGLRPGRGDDTALPVIRDRRGRASVAAA